MENSIEKRATTITLVVLLIYGILVAFHEGEFWPFSIYPMFSQGGNSWTRTVVRDVTENGGQIDWGATSVDQLPGVSFPLTPNDVDPIDVANFVSKTREWTPSRIEGLASTFSRSRASRHLLVFKVDGHIDDRDSVIVSYVPYVFITDDSTVVSPSIR